MKKTLALLATLTLLSAASVQAQSGKKPTTDLICINNQTSQTVEFRYRTTSDFGYGEWKEVSVSPSSLWRVWWTYAYPGQVSSHAIQVNFDMDVTDQYPSWQTYNLDSQPSIGNDCDLYGKDYAFQKNGKYQIDLYNGS